MQQLLGDGCYMAERKHVQEAKGKVKFHWVEGVLALVHLIT